MPLAKQAASSSSDGKATEESPRSVPARSELGKPADCEVQPRDLLAALGVALHEEMGVSQNVGDLMLKI